METISIIVPVYKAEAYLDKCIESIVSQTYENLEIILVDDGSPDRSGEICDAWAKKDSRIRVVHQENAGGAAARNAALDMARGAWIGFVDSDDYLAPDMYAHLAALLDMGADVAECGYVEAYGDTAEFACGKRMARFFSPSEAMAEHLRDRRFRQLIWNKLYRAETIGRIRFSEGKQIDDEFFTYRVLGNAGKLIWSDKICYAYRQQPNSVMHSIDSARRLQAVEAKQQRHAYIRDRFPELAALAAKDLWFTCLYQGQLVLREMEQSRAEDALNYLRSVLGGCPMEWKDTTCKEKIWLTLAKISFRGTCRLRNWLKIGL